MVVTSRVGGRASAARRLGRLVRHEPWLLVCAGATWAAGSILVAIHLLGSTGILRDFSVIHASGNGSVTNLREFGVGVPSSALSHADSVALVVFGVAGSLWMLRLARRAAGYRVGVVRGFFALAGFALFVATGAMHKTAQRTHSERSILESLISVWCFVFVATAFVVQIRSWSSIDPHVRAVGLGWSIPKHLLALVSIGGGLWIATALTARWADRAVAGERQLPL